jgi:DNA-binding NarL/FixJ family response regulator
MAKRTERRALAVLSQHALYRLATAELLRGHGFRVDECEIDADVHTLARSRPLDAVIVDLDHAHEDTDSLLQRVQALDGVDVILVGSPLRLAAVSNAGVETPNADGRVLVAAVNGRRPRPSAELARQLRVWSRLTRRQRDVLRWLAAGLDNRAIAHHLGTGERAVKLHVSALLVTLGVRNRTQLALTAHHAGLKPLR